MLSDLQKGNKVMLTRLTTVATLVTCCCVGWLFYQSLSKLGNLAFSVHQKRAYITMSSNPGLRIIRCYMVLHYSEVMVLIHRALFFTYS